MLKISFTNAEVSDHGYGLEVNGKSLEDIISTALGTKLSGSDVFTGNFVWQNYTYNGFLVAQLGGRWSIGSGCGFGLSGSDASGDRGRAVGGRLLYVPQTKVA